MMNTKKLILPSVIGCLAAGMTVAPAYAQDQQAGMLEEVVVTGIRKSLTDSLSIKRNNSSIVEAVSPEDIGKLPDTSIAESLARLPGLAGERVAGRTSGISVRGFSEEFVATTLNGRELLGIGDNRGVEFDLYPTEFLTGAVVYKTPDASLIHQGLGGTIDLQTRRPLESERVMAVNGSFEWNDQESKNPDFDDQGYRLSFNYSDKFANDTLGVALTLASMESPTQEMESAPWGYPDVTVDGEDVKIFGGNKPYVKSAMLERDTVSGIVQWAPTDRLSITADALYIDFLDSKVKRGLEEGGPVWGGTDWTATEVEDGLVTAGYLSGFHSVMRNDSNTKDAELSSFGLNGTYQLSDDWSIELDGAYSESEKSLIDIESYAGVGRALTDDQGPATARSFVMGGDFGIMYGDHPTLSTPDFSDPSVIRLAGPQAWGGAIEQFNEGLNNAQDGFVNNPNFEEELTSLRATVEGYVDFSIFNRVEFGANYSDRTKAKDNIGVFLTAPGINTNLPAEEQEAVGVPEEFIVGTTDLSYLGMGSMLAYDGLGLYQSGFYTATDARTFEPDRLGDTYEVSEELLTLYAMADFQAGRFSGNVGLQAVNADQQSSGFSTVVRENSEGQAQVVATPVTGGDDYWDILPSFNLSYELTENQQLRFGVAKTQTRPRMDEMKPNNQIGFNFDDGRRESDDPTFSAWSGSAGNPALPPRSSVNVDLAYEWYFADDGHLGVSAYTKDIDNWTTEKAVLTDFSEFIIPGYHDQGIDELISTSGFTNSLTSSAEGKLDGIEVQGSLPMRLVSERLDGLGMIASATFLDGEIEETREDGTVIESKIPGLSEETYQLTVFYEKNGFEVRVSGRKRDQFLTEGRGLSLLLVPQNDEGATLWDGQIGYDFGAAGFDSLDGLRVTLQGQNLTDEDTVKTEEDDSRRVIGYQSFGRTFLLGVNYNF